MMELNTKAYLFQIKMIGLSKKFEDTKGVIRRQ